MEKTAVYPGSFDPFTNGHLDMVKKAAKIFDRVYILIAINVKKKRVYGTEDMKRAIEETLRENNIKNCEVCVCSDLIARYTKEHKIGYMIRGLRNNMDYNYEENMAEVNKLMDPKLEYIYFRADNVALSSSMVKELTDFNQDVSRYVPPAVLKIIEGK